MNGGPASLPQDRLRELDAAAQRRNRLQSSATCGLVAVLILILTILNNDGWLVRVALVIGLAGGCLAITVAARDASKPGSRSAPAPALGLPADTRRLVWRDVRRGTPNRDPELRWLESNLARWNVRTGSRRTLAAFWLVVGTIGLAFGVQTAPARVLATAIAGLAIVILVRTTSMNRASQRFPRTSE